MRTKRLFSSATIALFAVFALFPAGAMAEFGFERLEVEITADDGSEATLAGSHPFAMKTLLDLNVDGTGEPEGAVKDLTVDLPAGFAGDPLAVPPCANEDFLTLHDSGPLEGTPSCPDSSAVGFIAARAPGEATAGDFGVAYNLRPPPGVAAKIGFRVLSVFITINLGLRSGGDHNVFASLKNIPQVEPFVGSELTIWGNPADSKHDPERGGCLLTPEIDSCKADIPEERAFLTLPRTCTGPLVTLFEASPWQNPGARALGKAQTFETLTGCDSLGFSPRIDSQPTTDHAESPSGLDFSLDITDEGLTDPDGRAHSDIQKAVVSLPEKVTANPSLAEGLATCSPGDLARETLGSQPGEGCPQASKIGNVEVETPLLEGEIFKGSVFIATQDDPTTTEPGAENPFDTLIAMYIVIKHPERGILVKLAGKVEPNSDTGQLVTTFDDIPPVPFSHFRFHFREGGRSPLITPPTCDTYTTKAVFTPGAYPSRPFTTAATFQITRGVGGGPCPPAGTPPFAPGFTAGSINGNAGTHSPFYLRLTRRDGDQDLTRFDATLPPGLVAKLAGVSQCSDAEIAAADSRRGRLELADPSCPANSQIGRTLAGAGVGSQLTYVPGRLYLAGPFGGGPLSVVAIVPAVAGPFDVGTVVVRQALQIDRRTARVTVDGAHSDPIPHMLAGIPLRVRDIRAYVDRSGFTLNPTSCDPFAVSGEIWGGGFDTSTTADDSPVSRTERYQAANCRNLGFKPGLSLRLKGGTKRGGHPALRGVFKPRPGDANLSDLVLRLPRSAFLDQGHIRTICTRVQFAADNCPKGAIYGRATAFTPLLDQPLKGPVYLRSSNHNLPDLVADLRGLVDVEAVARIDSKDGGIRATFEGVPDAPVSKVVVDMQGGKKGLIVNSRDLCSGKSRANARMTGHNGKRYDIDPVVRASCGKQGKPKKGR